MSGGVPAPAPSLRRALFGVIALTSVCGIVEVIGYTDVGHIYPAIMTGNTVQLGLNFASSNWTMFYSILYAIGSFFIGCFISALVRNKLESPTVELLLMACILVAASLVRLWPALRFPVELPLLAWALSMQGIAISRFGGVSLQTLVVTNNMVKFSDALIGRYVEAPSDGSKRPALPEVVLPGAAWLTYCIMAAIGTVLNKYMSMPFVVPVALLVAVAVVLRRYHSMPV